MKIEAMIEEIEKRKKCISKERNKLDDLIYELEGLKDSCIRAYDNLQDARDALSELV